MFAPENPLPAIEPVTTPTTTFVGIIGSIEPGELGGDPAVQAWLDGVRLTGRAW